MARIARAGLVRRLAARAWPPVGAQAREMFGLRRGDLDAVSVLSCLPAIALCLAVALPLGQAQSGMVAVSGAFTAGLGAFQGERRHDPAPMLLAVLGMALAAFLGSLVDGQATGAHGTAWLALLVLLAGLVAGACGLTAAAGSVPWWVTLQWAVVYFVASSFPADLAGASTRGALVLGGGLLQLVAVTGCWRLLRRRPEPAGPGPRPGDVLTALLRNRPAARLAIGAAAMAMVAVLLVHLVAVANAYWVPITALALLKAEARQTMTRGLYRLVGTVLGAGLATVLVAVIRPGDAALAVMVVVMAGVSYAALRSGYAAFIACLTAYVVLIVALAGLPEPVAALHRIGATVLGGGLALATAQLVERWNARVGGEGW